MTEIGGAQEQRVGRFFSDFARNWDELYGGKRNLFWRAFDHTFRRDIYERYQLTFEALGENLTGASVLDVGCGSGIYCVEAARRGATKVIGVDVAHEMVALAAAHARNGGFAGTCEFVVSGFPPSPGIPAFARTYDYGIVMGVMDYVVDAPRFLEALRPLVTRRVVLSFPGRHWLRAPMRRYRYQFLKRCDVYDYDEHSIGAACVAAGFSRVDLRRLEHSGICYIVTAHADAE